MFFAKIKEQQIHALICWSTIQHCSTRLKTFLQNLKKTLKISLFAVINMRKRRGTNQSLCHAATHKSKTGQPAPTSPSEIGTHVPPPRPPHSHKHSHHQHCYLSRDYHWHAMLCIACREPIIPHHCKTQNLLFTLLSITLGSLALHHQTCFCRSKMWTLQTQIWNHFFESRFNLHLNPKPPCTKCCKNYLAESWLGFKDHSMNQTRIITDQIFTWIKNHHSKYVAAKKFLQSHD
jgi:hypothetical protein